MHFFSHNRIFQEGKIYQKHIDKHKRDKHIHKSSKTNICPRSLYASTHGQSFIHFVSQY